MNVLIFRKRIGGIPVPGSLRVAYAAIPVSNMQLRARCAIGSHPRIMLAGQSSCVVFPPLQRGAQLSPVPQVPNVG
jgi:hypothetical protein